MLKINLHAFLPYPFPAIKINITFIRSLLEQSCTVWQSMISQENKNDLERVQMSAFKVIMKHEYVNYQNAKNRLEMISVEERRANLCKHFAHKNHIFKTTLI